MVGPSPSPSNSWSPRPRSKSSETRAQATGHTCHGWCSSPAPVSCWHEPGHRAAHSLGMGPRRLAGNRVHGRNQAVRPSPRPCRRRSQPPAGQLRPGPPCRPRRRRRRQVPGGCSRQNRLACHLAAPTGLPRALAASANTTASPAAGKGATSPRHATALAGSTSSLLPAARRLVVGTGSSSGVVTRHPVGVGGRSRREPTSGGPLSVRRSGTARCTSGGAGRCVSGTSRANGCSSSRYAAWATPGPRRPPSA
jgi:hypothetical protein